MTLENAPQQKQQYQWRTYLKLAKWNTTRIIRRIIRRIGSSLFLFHCSTGVMIGSPPLTSLMIKPYSFMIVCRIESAKS